MSRGARLLPAVIVLAAAGLRLWGLAQGLPSTTIRPDERELLLHTATFPAGDLNPRWFVYPNLYFWVVWLWDEALLALRRVWRPAPSYAEMLATDLPTLILYGRALSVLVGTATVAALYRLGTRLGGPALGTIAAVLLAANHLHVRESHVLKNEIWLTLGVVLTFLALARWMERRTPARAAAAGVAIGLSTALMYAGALLGSAAWAADALSAGRRGVARLWPSAQLCLIAAVAAAVFVLGNFHLVTDTEGMRAVAYMVGVAMYATAPAMRPPPGAGWLAELQSTLRHRAFGHHLTVSLRYGCGLLATLALPAALVLAWRRPRKPELVVATVFLAAFYLVAGASRVQLARYFVTVTPLIALLLGQLVLLLARSAGSPAGRAVLAGVLTLALTVEPLAASVAYDRIASATDTRVLASRWMAAHLPRDAVVGQIGSGIFPIADPELPPGIRRAPLRPGEADLDRHGVTHVVTHEHQLPFSRLTPRFMAALAPRLRLLAEFSPYRHGPAGLFEDEDAYYVPFADAGGVVRPGPLVRIYAFAPP